MPSAPRYRLTQLFAVTTSAVLFAYGIHVAQNDSQTGIMIVLAASAITLSLLFLRIARVAWFGMAFGFVVGAIWYWWCDAYNRTEPADRLFEFVVSAIWFSILSGAAAFLGGAIFRGSNESQDV